MTILTIKKKLDLPKTEFKDEKEVLLFLINYYYWDELDFRELNFNEISDNLLNKLELSKQKDIWEFDNI